MNHYFYLKENVEAIDDFSKVIEMNPKDYEAFFARGNAKYQANKKDEACLDWSKAGELGYMKVYDVIKKTCN